MAFSVRNPSPPPFLDDVEDQELWLRSGLYSAGSKPRFRLATPRHQAKDEAVASHLKTQLAK